MLSRRPRLTALLLVLAAALPAASPAAPPVITAQPAGGAVDLFGTFSLSVHASGTEPLAYQWKLDGKPIAGATESNYFANGAGAYSVVVSNAAGTAESAAAVVLPDDPSIALKPFTIPNTTPAGVFPDLRAWNPEPAGASGVVTVGADGHFQVGGRRIRFFGVDLTSNKNFPTHAGAELHAQRLARFGFNSVRFHWADSFWPYYTEEPGSLIIKDSATSRRFDENARDRLHYFMARCADVGIYANVNLLVARTFQKDDGLGAEIATMPWARQHLLSFFNDRMVELQKEYAAWLLASPNPYRDNRPLAQDPAVAIVEILNENGLADGWLHGQLAAMPAVYTDELQRRWNAWLRARYADQAAMYEGWFAVDEPLGLNRLVDVTTAPSSEGWSLYRDTPNGAAATTSVAPDFNGAPCRVVQTTSAGNFASVQLLHKDLPLAAHEAYTLSFWAKVEDPDTVHTVKLYAARAGYPDLCEPLKVQGTEWKHYTRTFVMRTTEERSRLGFCLGVAPGRTWIADVQLCPGGTVGTLPAGITLEAANIPALLSNTITDHIGMREDWVRFLLDLERTYWSGMRDYIRSLGFRAVVVGTIARNSPASCQAELQAMDTHDYWNYPVLGPAYRDHSDKSDWSMEHRAMVNFPRENDMLYGALRQVKGYPNIATEYEHPAPNLYAGEQEFFFPAFAALQDLDGYWVYSYWTNDRLAIWDHWDSLNSMNKLANIPLAAALFRRDVSPALNEYVVAMTPAREITEIVTRAGHFNMPHAAFVGMSPSVALVSRIRMAIGEGATGLATPPARPDGPVFVSDTGELRWDSTDPAAGFFTIDTPRTKAFAGFGSGRHVELGGVAITTGTTRLDWCTVGVTLLEGESFAGTAAGRALVVATGQYANTGWKWRDANHNGLTNWGGAPFLVEIVPAQVELPVPAARVRAWALSPAGARLGELPVTEKNGRATLTLGTVGDTLWYEVQIAAEAAASYAAWRTAHFAGADLADPAISGPAADPERCGLSNYARYAFGLAARGPVQSPVRHGAVTVDGATYLTLAFPRRATGTDVRYTIESSSDLVTWAPVAGAVYTPAATSVTYRDLVATAPGTRRFLRLALSQP